MKSEMLLLILTDAIRKNQCMDKSYGYGGYRQKNCKGLSSLFNSVNEAELRKKMLQLSNLIPNIEHVSKY